MIRRQNESVSQCRHSNFYIWVFDPDIVYTQCHAVLLSHLRNITKCLSLVFLQLWGKRGYSRLTMYKCNKSSQIKIDSKKTIHSYYPDQGELITVDITEGIPVGRRHQFKLNTKFGLTNWACSYAVIIIQWVGFQFSIVLKFNLKCIKYQKARFEVISCTVRK